MSKLKHNAHKKAPVNDHNYSGMFPQKRRKSYGFISTEPKTKVIHHKPDAQIINEVVLGGETIVYKESREAPQAIKVMIYAIFALWCLLAIAKVVQNLGSDALMVAFALVLIGALLAKVFYLLLRLMAVYYWESVISIMIMMSFVIFAQNF